MNEHLSQEVFIHSIHSLLLYCASQPPMGPHGAPMGLPQPPWRMGPHGAPIAGDVLVYTV